MKHLPGLPRLIQYYLRLCNSSFLTFHQSLRAINLSPPQIFLSVILGYCCKLGVGMLLHCLSDEYKNNEAWYCASNVRPTELHSITKILSGKYAIKCTGKLYVSKVTIFMKICTCSRFVWYPSVIPIYIRVVSLVRKQSYDFLSVSGSTLKRWVNDWYKSRNME